MRGLTVRSIEAKSHPQTKMVFWYLFGASRGAQSRIKIMSILRDVPRNTNQLSLDVGMDYKGVKHHLRKLEENDMVSKMGNGYSTFYYVSSLFETGKEIFDEIVSKMNTDKKIPIQ